MPKQSKSQNRHPVDQLFDVREQIKVLEAQEKELRAHIMDSGDTDGDEHVAMIKESSRKTLDRPALEARYGKDVIAGFCKESAVTTLTLYKKAAQQIDVFS
jgi:hypothetical protein